ncbi:hypothetical protein NVP1261O_73 [Vibrio phage 1.261.O._10N.286.51.A7]|uniref:Uncharacterized protein n=1 Tax=Vibrio phage 1.261.O._10N.286.51.A7 TaxID=1881237 RepID=A0A2I7RZL3_9CAUD|nr:hypothetical protein HOU80_gp29 [Vibrio phage 1.261.O._10N.286.51.A7]AUR99077.1 hypothetical protein NVP1261O_73 [Vibrio phage 1.261.O._10N.286.51.A7]
MKKALEINSCHACPFKSHKGAFGQVSYVPYCTKSDKTLPYDVNEYKGILIASPKGVIPTSCPLPNWRETP